jgi:hypothetical protein
MQAAESGVLVGWSLGRAGSGLWSSSWQCAPRHNALHGGPEFLQGALFSEEP